ncbi:GtrA family protein [Candidatus Kaiserbacteria bacterium]|nr:GtrA family protein [Candidatus Kaiserbacteria bacterium]
MIGLVPEKYRLLVRYGITGVFGAFVQVCTLWAWVALLGLREQYLWGVVVGFCTALAITFPLQKYWSFRDGAHHRAPRQFVWYTLIALASLFINTFSLSVTKTILESTHVDFFRIWYLVAETIIVSGVALLSFLINRAITFRQHTQEDNKNQ